MHRHAPGTAATRVRTFAPLAALAAAGLTLPAGAPVPLRTRAAGAAGGTVTETITSAYRTGR